MCYSYEYDDVPEYLKSTGNLIDYIVSIKHDSAFCDVVSYKICHENIHNVSTPTFDESLFNVVAEYDIETGTTSYYDLSTGEKVDIDL